MAELVLKKEVYEIIGAAMECFDSIFHLTVVICQSLFHEYFSG